MGLFTHKCANRTQLRARTADEPRVKPASSTTTAPRPGSAPEASPRPPERKQKSSFATHLATHRGLNDSAAVLGARTSSKPSSPHGPGCVPTGDSDPGPRGSRSKRAADTDDPPPALDGSPFRPLPACVFAPNAGRPPHPLPAAVPPDVALMATELLRSLQVGGERGRGRVRLLLASGRDGEPLEITVEESPTGITARLPSGHDEGSRRLVSAIGEELQRRGIELSAER